MLTLPAGAAGIDASTLLVPADLSWLPAGAQRAALPGVPRSPTYDGLRWAAPGGTDVGLTVQWWHFPSAAEATARFQKNLAGAPGAARMLDLAKAMAARLHP